MCASRGTCTHLYLGCGRFLELALRALHLALVQVMCVNELLSELYSVLICLVGLAQIP